MFIRKDLPFDTRYSHLTQQLDLVKDRTLCINDPRGLRDGRARASTRPQELNVEDKLDVEDITATVERQADRVGQSHTALAV